jgi:hypothetical protein
VAAWKGDSAGERSFSAFGLVIIGLASPMGESEFIEQQF